MNRVKRISQIERKAYPKYMRSLSHARSLADIIEYLECDEDEMILEMGKDWYLLGVQRGDCLEVCDIATAHPGAFPMWKLMPLFKAFKTLIVDARDSTSYRVIKALERRGKIEIIKDSKWDWGEDVMHNMTLLIQK